LRAEVPDGIFSLAVEADEATSRAEHAAFADRCMPLLATAQGEPGQIRSALLEHCRLRGKSLRLAVSGTYA
jgi:hypothetical protein